MGIELNMKKLTKIILLVLLGISAGLEVLYFLQLNQTPFAHLLMVDAKAYHLKALQIIEEGWINKSVYYQAPLYPYFLAFIYKLFGVHFFWVQGIQAALSLFTVLIIFWLGKILFNEKVGLFSAATFVFYGVFLFYSGLLLKVTLSIFFTSLLLLTLLKTLNRPSALLYFLGGVLLGVNLTLRENYFLLFPALLFWILFVVPAEGATSRWINIKWAMFFLWGTLTFLSPFTIQNYYHSEEVLFTSYQAGANFYLGNNPASKGFYTRLPFIRANPEFEEKDFKDEAEKRTGRTLSPKEVSRYWFHRTLTHFKEDPILFPKLLLFKFYLFINNYEVPDNYDFYFMRSLAPSLKIGFISFGLIFPLAMLGIFLSRNKSPSFLLFYFFLGTYSFSVLIFYINSRFRMPVVPALIPFMAYSLVEGWRKIRTWNRKEIILTVLTVLFLFVLSFNPYADIQDFSFSHFKLGLEYEKNGDFDTAVAEYRKALAIRPDFSWAHNMLGGVLERKGELDHALLEYQKAIDLEPGFAEAHFNKAIAWDKKGNQDLAILEYQKVLAFKPETPEVYNNLGAIYEQKGWTEKAEEEYKKAIQARPIFVEAYNNLGVLYLKTGRLEEAETAFKKALNTYPDHPLVLKNLQTLKALKSGS